MRIGLYGIYGVYNFGCEAIVRGAVQFIEKVYPGSDITYFSYNYDYDKTVLSDLNICVYEIKFTKNTTKKIINFVQSFLNTEKRLILFNYKEMLNKIDVLFSIGGDIYTIPQIIREKVNYSYYNQLVDICNKAILKDKKVIVYGASIGPWGENHIAETYYSTNMKKYLAILCRETSSLEYLKNLGFNNVNFFPDPAFQVKSKCYNIIEKKYIGINFSPLSFKEVFGDIGICRIESLAKLMDETIYKFNMDLLFIPHVISNNEYDNDLNFMKSIKEKMIYKNRVYLADHSGGFLSIKEQLKECQIVVSARMHCAINAIVENTPTIFISYSQKSIGMCEYVYGNKNYVISLSEIEKEFLTKLQDVLKNKVKIKEFLVNRNNKISDYYDKNIEKVKTLLSD